MSGQAQLVGLLDEFMKWRRSLMKSETTVRRGWYGVRAFLQWLEERHGVRAAGEIRTEHLYKWQEHVAGMKNRRGLPLKPGSMNGVIENVKVFLDYLARMGHVQNAVTGVLQYVKAPEQLSGSVLTHEQVRRMLSGTPDDMMDYRNRAMLELLYTAGIRAGELLGLDVEGVDFLNATALVTGKGNKQRVVPIGRTALKNLETYLVAVRPYLVRNHAERALFLTKKGTRVGYRWFLMYVHDCAKSAGVDVRVTPHTFRRSCATELIRAGANVYHVKELLGHASLNTLRAYTRLTITDLKKTHAQCHPRERDEG